MGCIYHQPNTNSSNYINTNQKFIVFFLEKGFKLALPAILFKFLRDSIRETKIGSTSKKGRLIPNGRLISNLLVENDIVDDLLVSGLTEELVNDARKICRGKNLKSRSLISKVVKPNFVPSKDDICGTRIQVVNFLIFTKIDPPKVLEYYLESYLKDGIDPMADPFNLLETYPNMHGKRKKESHEEGPSRPLKKKKKVATFLDGDEVSLSERHKVMLLKDTYGVIQQSSKASNIPIPGKLPKAINLFVFDSVIYEWVLPTQPFPSHSQSIPVS